MKNLFCDAANLKNEADVETWFISKLLTYLGFAPEDINLKTSINEYKIGKGSKSILYKPDYVILAKKFPTIVIDAKSPHEKIEDWISQCSSYCLEVNRLYEHNPVEFFVLSNGLETRLYKWDESEPLLVMEFQDFAKGNSKLEELDEFLQKSSVVGLAAKKLEELNESTFKLEPIPLSELPSLFSRLHTFIWKAEKMTPSAAFEELMKIVFIKIKKDRELRQKIKTATPKVKDIVFSIAWIKGQTENDNPINDPLFKNLVLELEKEIRDEDKRRIFNTNENINLHPSTIEKVVEAIEHIDFYKLDEDVHGRMFESFLDATIRGKELGQFFTPRDIVQLVVNLADIEVEKDHVETIMDPCCGSGGFLIAALRDMLQKSEKLVGLSAQEKNVLRKRIANKSLFGIDAGSDPPIHRIARMNMYLHGDGGSNIYFADSIDKRIGQVGRTNLELDEEIESIRKSLVSEERKFDVILSNPPFSMKYTRDNKEQREILNQYEIAAVDKQEKSLLSSVMFLERYKELVSEKGRVFAIIDESILSGDKYKFARDYIRKTFLIRGVISLPGDAFRHSAARVKTSILILQPKKIGDQQGEVFMEMAIYLGLSEKTAKRIGIPKAELENGKKEEMSRIVKAFADFMDGKNVDYVVSSDNVTDRLDVKNCLGDSGRRKSVWSKQGLKVLPLGKLLTLAINRSVQVDPEETYKLLKVTYDGEVLEAETKFGEDLSYARLYKLKEWDILSSNMGVGRGAIGIVPKYLSGYFVSNEYTVLTAGSKEEAIYYVNILRSKEILGDILTSTTGLNRGRIKWNDMSKISVPVYDEDKYNTKNLVNLLSKLWETYENYTNSDRTQFGQISSELKLEDEKSRKRWLAFKPPE
jgi:type I restriction enzyme M protein